jgi:hypothetical protein
VVEMTATPGVVGLASPPPPGSAALKSVLGKAEAT